MHLAARGLSAIAEHLVLVYAEMTQESQTIPIPKIEAIQATIE